MNKNRKKLIENYKETSMPNVRHIDKTPSLTNNGFKEYLPPIIDKYIKIESKENEHPLIGNVVIETGENDISEFMDFKADAFDIPLAVRIKVSNQLRAKLAVKRIRERYMEKVAKALYEKYKDVEENLDKYKNEIKKGKKKPKKPKETKKRKTAAVKPSEWNF
jgi:hypothetical protein